MTLCKPHPSPAPDLPDTIRLDHGGRPGGGRRGHDGKPIHWLLLTSHVVASPKKARRIVDLYRKRWTIEEFFRTLKSAGFDIEGVADIIGDPEVMMKLVAAGGRGDGYRSCNWSALRDGTTEEKTGRGGFRDRGPACA